MNYRTGQTFDARVQELRAKGFTHKDACSMARATHPVTPVVEPPPMPPKPEPQVIGAIDEWNLRLEALTDQGLTKRQAVAKIVETHNDLRERYVAEYNTQVKTPHPAIKHNQAFENNVDRQWQLTLDKARQRMGQQHKTAGSVTSFARQHYPDEFAMYIQGVNAVAQAKRFVQSGQRIGYKVPH